MLTLCVCCCALLYKCKYNCTIYDIISFCKEYRNFLLKLPVSVTDNGPGDMAMDHGSHTAD